MKPYQSRKSRSDNSGSYFRFWKSVTCFRRLITPRVVTVALWCCHKAVYSPIEPLKFVSPVLIKSKLLGDVESRNVKHTEAKPRRLGLKFPFIGS